MKLDKNIHCPCHCGILYKNCCKPFHLGNYPKNALQLMRSRYSAYFLNLPKYIIQTTHPDHPDYLIDHKRWAQEITNFSKSTTFKDLEILDFSEKQNTAVVIFKAYLWQNGHDTTFTEKSFFVKSHEKWYYLRGETQPHSAEINIFK